MQLTEDQFRQMMPNAGARLDAHWPYVNLALSRSSITTAPRIVAFMAQLAHESGEYRYMEELADGSAYEGRVDLGNTEPGDGVKFKGHGPIQITGRVNHRACGLALGLDLIAEPRLICRTQFGTLSATWFWDSHKLSPLIDLGWFKTVTRMINGGYNGLEERVAYWNRNRSILGLPLFDLSFEEAAIKAFQASQGLTADGVVGPITHAAACGGVGSSV